MYIRAGQRIKVKDLVTGLMVTSGNDAAMAVAMLIGGSRDACVELMNRKAKQLGFESFVFTDPAGYEDTNQVNALEFCQFCRIYVQNFLEYLDVLTNQEAFKMGSRTINNSNDLLGRYAGVDGLKTGYIDESGYNISLTAERDGMRLVAVIMGIKAKDIMNAKLMRMEEGASLLSYGFQQACISELGHNTQQGNKGACGGWCSGGKLRSKPGRQSSYDLPAYCRGRIWEGKPMAPFYRGNQSYGSKRGSP